MKPHKSLGGTLVRAKTRLTPSRKLDETPLDRSIRCHKMSLSTKVTRHLGKQQYQSVKVNEIQQNSNYSKAFQPQHQEETILESN